MIRPAIAEAFALSRGDRAWLACANDFVATFEREYTAVLGPPQRAYASDAGVHIGWPLFSIHLYVEADDDAPTDELFVLQVFPDPLRPGCSTLRAFKTGADILEAAAAAGMCTTGPLN